MKLVNFLNDLFKEDGFRLIDANKREYLIGKPKKKNPIILELLDSSMPVSYTHLRAHET